MTEQSEETGSVLPEKKRRFPKATNKQKSINDQRIKNPCHEEALLSHACIDQHHGQKDSCSQYFLNYQKCKEFWTAVQRDRRSKGIKPILPEIQDRDSVMEEYKHLFKGGKK